MRRTNPALLLALAVTAFAVGLAETNGQEGQELDASQTTTTTTVVRTSPIPPPPPKQEVIVPEPSPAHVWIPGSWEREPNKWVWVAGRWVKPPFLRARYIPGYWRFENSKYVWQAGHWASAPQGVVVQKPIAPPPTFVEAIPKPPAPKYAWVPGHWNWNGITWTWTPGVYVMPPQPKAAWIPGHWRKGLLGAYRWTPGHWALA